MQLGQTIGNLARYIDYRIGIRAWLRGEPRPPAGGFDLDGEKLIDWGWICANLPPGPRRALEIGPGKSPVVPAMLAAGYEVTAVDLCEDLSLQVAGFHLILGDFNAVQIEPNFDVIVLCSAVEHVGLSGRYNSAEDPDGDLKAMRKVRSLLRSGGQVFLTIPVGKDIVHRPWHRVYGRGRLPLLLEGFEIVKSRFLSKAPWGPWRECDRDTALNHPPEIQRYALGEFILTRCEP